ncbi:prephenate dehydrogenase/arogenate dehydrogenase family protein [Dankookia rubra]|uniref:prephenate dehydrogenase/arogenate dehydrogenase family protein n=1 Tax=Dankookia rubra TaxID=1442381 RepID=UPI00140B7804|nr:prephenate dehydrogenase/arogenate dehydrogenase family protein [Dankookia rubra]
MSGAAPPRFGQVALIGIGLINGSIARDMRRLGLAERLVCAARQPETRMQALALGLADDATPDPAEAVRGADLVILGTPVGAAGEVARAIAPALRPDAIVTDVGSVKGRVVDFVAPHLDLTRFVPAHPIAGGEQSGPGAATDRLFEGRWCIVTPSGRTDPDAVEAVGGLWRALGARVEIMEAAHHDRVLAVISHLPHLLAFNVVNTASDVEGALQGEVMKYAAGGFRDFTRIAGADPALWRDVMLHNRAALLEMMGRYSENLAALQHAIRWGESEALYERLASAHDIRRGVSRAMIAASPQAGRGAGTLSW